MIPASVYNRHLDEVLQRMNHTGNTIPAQRAAFKQKYSFSSQPFELQLLIWDSIWKYSNNFKVQVQAFLFLEQHLRYKEKLPLIWTVASTWQEQVTDWGLCDALAKVFTKALEVIPKQVYPRLQDWNRSHDLWKRRQSVVSLLYFHRTKSEYLPMRKITRLVEPLLADKEYYVQKGVGWAIREVHSVYPADGYQWIKKHVKDLSAIAFTIAIEKMGMPEKEELKTVRKKKKKTILQ
jgi:3-methyladenine DNA glycosylase AlkD